jgi:hypothetical protein
MKMKIVNAIKDHRQSLGMNRVEYYQGIFANPKQQGYMFESGRRASMRAAEAIINKYGLKIEIKKA